MSIGPLTSTITNLKKNIRQSFQSHTTPPNPNSDPPRLFISPDCKELIRDLEEVCLTTDSTGAPTCELNKSDRNRTHMSDALGYYISKAFPLRGTFHL